jgi:hypothetical protein
VSVLDVPRTREAGRPARRNLQTARPRDGRPAGDADPVDKPPCPQKISLPSIAAGHSAPAIGLGEFHTCAIEAGGLVKCWGTNGYGQLGIGNDPVIGSLPVTVPGAPSYLPLAHPCGLHSTHRGVGQVLPPATCRAPAPLSEEQVGLGLGTATAPLEKW